MRETAIESWPRRERFRVCSRYDQPCCGVCANCEVTAFYPHAHEHGRSFTAWILYVIRRAANATSEFRQRIRRHMLVEHEVVHPSVTLLTGNDLPSFCHVRCMDDFPTFVARAAESIARVREHPSLEDEPGADDLLFMSPIPWVSFTSFDHPLRAHPPDSIPRFAWRKRFEEGRHLRTPVSVHGQQALLDGLHMGRFYQALQALLSDPASALGGQQAS